MSIHLKYFIFELNILSFDRLERARELAWNVMYSVFLLIDFTFIARYVNWDGMYSIELVHLGFYGRGGVELADVSFHF